MELRRVLHGKPPMEGLGGGVGLGVPTGLSLGVCTGVPLGVGRGLPRGEGWGVTCVRGTDLPLWSGWRWCRRRGDMGAMGDRGMDSLGGTVKGGWRRTLGLEGTQGVRGWQGVVGSDFGVEEVWVELGSGLDLVVCMGFSEGLGLAGRVCVRGCMSGEPIFGCWQWSDRGPTPFRRGSEECGEFGDWHRSGDCGGMKKRLWGCDRSCGGKSGQ